MPAAPTPAVATPTSSPMALTPVTSPPAPVPVSSPPLPAPTNSHPVPAPTTTPTASPPASVSSPPAEAPAVEVPSPAPSKKKTKKHKSEFSPCALKELPSDCFEKGSDGYDALDFSIGLRKEWSRESGAEKITCMMQTVVGGLALGWAALGLFL